MWPGVQGAHSVPESLCITSQCPSLTHPDLSNAHGAARPRDMWGRGRSLFSLLKGEEEAALQCPPEERRLAPGLALAPSSLPAGVRTQVVGY